MYTDIHSHVIWGVDDGAETRKETFRMLKDAVADGIGTIICAFLVGPVAEFCMPYSASVVRACLKRLNLGE